jgi:hypothetical protein
MESGSGLLEGMTFNLGTIETLNLIGSFWVTLYIYDVILQMAEADDAYIKFW